MAMAIYKNRRNTPANTLLNRYIDKKSGRVCEARSELKYRFDYLDWSVQKRILVAFLASGKTDRKWAYEKLLKFWDDSFTSVVESLWNQYHEQACSWPIIRHFSEEYILENMDSLLVGNNYYFICKRLGHRPDFLINRKKLTQTDYLSVLYTADKTIDNKEALEMLYEIIGSRCSVGLIIVDIGSPSFLIRNVGFNPMDIRMVRRAIYYLEKMGNKEPVEIFMKWCNKVAKIIKESQEYKELASQSVPDDEYVARLANIAVIYMYLNLPLSIMSKIKNIDNEIVNYEKI